MPAHLRPIPVRLCDWSPNCGRHAERQLFTTYNEPIADYCGKHADAALATALAATEPEKPT